MDGGGDHEPQALVELSQRAVSCAHRYTALCYADRFSAKVRRLSAELDKARRAGLRRSLVLETGCEATLVLVDEAQDLTEEQVRGLQIGPGTGV